MLKVGKRCQKALNVPSVVVGSTQKVCLLEFKETVAKVQKVEAFSV